MFSRVREHLFDMIIEIISFKIFFRIEYFECHFTKWNGNVLQIKLFFMGSLYD
jgi:hypothetical protein